jgi:hypothetical protein
MVEDLLYMIEKGENMIGGRKKTKKKIDDRSFMEY